MAPYGAKGDGNSEQVQPEPELEVAPEGEAGGVGEPSFMPLSRSADDGNNPPRVVVKYHDMPESMQRVAFELSVLALGRYELERDMAHFLKDQFDDRFQPTWHCVVGRHFGSYLTSEAGSFIYFYIGKLAVLLFRAGHVMPRHQ